MVNAVPVCQVAMCDGTHRGKKAGRQELIEISRNVMGKISGLLDNIN